MGKFFAIAGCRAVGKTTLQRGLKENLPNIIAYEKKRNDCLNYRLDIEKEYYLNERFYINQQVEEFHRIKNSEQNGILVRGPEHLEFCVFHYPKCHGKDWDIENGLAVELQALRGCRSDHILYLTASTEVIWERCKNDTEKTRDSLQYWLNDWQPYVDKYMRSLNNVTVLNTDEITASEVLTWALNWINALL